MAPSCYHHKPHLLAFFHVTLTFLLLVTSRAAPLSFNYEQLGGDKSNTFNISGDVSQDNQVLQLTNYEKDSLGRVTYSKLFHLWNINTSEVTDFTTRFSFSINTPNKSYHGDGITFYLARPNFPMSQIDGSGIGLASRVQLSNPNYTKENPFVAVEFDTFVNDWDPKYDHVGIDVNSISTNHTTQWFTSMDERGYDAEVSYDSSSNNLTVTFTGYQDNKTIQQHLFYVVNLRDVLPDWVEFGFTSATGFFWEYHTLNSWSFNSSLDFEAKKDGTKTGLVIGLSVGGAFALICVIGLVCLLKWKLRNKGMKDESHFDLAMDSDFERSSLPKKFTYEELARSTNNFANEHKIGAGGFGAVYKGFIRDLKHHVAIKKVSKESNQGVKEYASEVKVISQLRHKNLVQLYGWCHKQNDLLLVYEFVENGSLDSYIFKGKGLLIWTVRYNIARGLASALLYLHEECEHCVLHRDIKSSNVMLDSNFNTKLGDFGLARLMNHETESKTTVLAGTYGYLSPEAATRGKASRESDVYSFGVVALEIACGRKAIEPSLSEEHIYLVDWVCELYGNGDLLKAADSRLYGEFNEKEVERLMIVGLWCTHTDHLQRPVISTAKESMATSTTSSNSTPPYKPYRHHKTLTTHTRAVSCVKFSNDGNLLASASLDKTLIIYSSTTLSLLHRLTGHSEGINDIAWSSDSHYICSASDDKTLRIWDANTGDCVKTLRGHGHNVFCVNFNPQSNYIVSGSFDETVRVWEVKTGKSVHVIKAHAMPVTSVDFNRDGSLIVSGSHDGSCKIWDTNSGALLKTLIDDKVPAVSFAKFSPNGKFILVATLNDTLKLWNYAAGRSLKMYSGHVNRVYCLTSTFSVTNGRYIVSGSEDRCLYLWDLQQKNMIQKLEGHTDTVISVTCHPTENKIASAGLDGDRTVRIWVQDS